MSVFFFSEMTRAQIFNGLGRLASWWLKPPLLGFTNDSNDRSVEGGEVICDLANPPNNEQANW